MFRPLLLTLFLSALSGAALAGPPSSLVNASFIDGAEIVTSTPALAQFAASLRQVAANVNGQCKQSESASRVSMSSGQPGRPGNTVSPGPGERAWRV